MTEDPPVMSLQAEMDRESDRRAADREKPSAENSATHAEQMADIPVTPEEMAEVEDAVDLDATTEQRAAKINMTEVADISETPHPEAAKDEDPKDDKRNCGLPERLWPVKEIVAYELLHSVTGPMRDKIEYTTHERNMYDRYQKLVMRAAGKDHFVAAYRMFNAKLPERRAQALDLNAMKVS